MDIKMENWFNDFTPDIEIVTLDENVINYVKRIIKRAVVHEISGAKKPQVVQDEIVSNIMGTDVYYIGLGTKKLIINHVNKCCGLNLDPYALNIRLVLNGEPVIFVEADGINTRGLLSHCMHVQINYCLRKYFLRQGKMRNSHEFALHVIKRSDFKDLYPAVRLF